MQKAIDILDKYKKIDFGCNVDGLHNVIDMPTKEIQRLEEDKTNVSEKYYSLPDISVSCPVEDDRFK